MWSHYADGHKGICLQFERTDKRPFLQRAQKIKYVDSLPRLDFFRLRDWINELLITKLKRWEYEDEWRIIEMSGPGIYQLPEGVLTGVILGCKISKSDESRIISWLNKCKKAITLYRAQIKENDDRLEIIQI